MTIKEFWESIMPLAIHCDTEEKAVKLLKIFNKMGYRWNSGDSYLEYNCWKAFKKGSCYSNDSCFGSLDEYMHNSYEDYKIIEFEELEEFQPECKTLEFENIKDCESKKYDELIALINKYVPFENQEEVIEALDELIELKE